MAKTHTPVLVWHYTTGEKLASIQVDSVIRPATLYLSAGEIPVVWFSMNQYFERTAAKRIWPEGGGERGRAATLSEMRELGAGMYRLGVSPRSLLGGETLRRKAKIDRQTWSGLGAIARDMGASESDWWGSLSNVLLSDCVVEVMNDDLKWVPWVPVLLERCVEAI